MRPFFLILICCAALLGGCDACYNVACDEPDVATINGLHFTFDKETFNLNEVDNATVLRFNPGNFEQPLDTIFLKDVLTDNERSFSISINSTGQNGQVAFVYGIYDNSHEYAFIITDIVTKGFYPTDCCCCYRNTEKTFVLNGEAKDLSGTTEAVVLSK
jgi:hypothetical protein